ncbi:MAG: type VI secretion system baseplate subunit TssK [Desulfobacterales bacterium]|nr:type VI secretion system baseplate subunit TssK [Desulfobacterales bacterium]
MADTLARVHWKMGQSILPDFFVTQEESLLRDTILRFKSIGVPFYGIGSLEWNSTLISEGVLSITQMTLVMPSGLLLNVPENARVTPFNLGLVGSTRVSVFCHFVMGTQKAEDGSDGWQDEGSEIPRAYYDLVLSSEQSTHGIHESMKLATFEKDPDDVWHLSEEYIPPLLRIGTTPFFEKSLNELEDVLEFFRINLGMETSGYLSGDALISSKSCMKSSLKMQRFLANIKTQVHCHPYYLYEALNDFYTEICYYKKILPEYATHPYKHDQLAECLNRLVIPLIEQMKMIESKSPYLSFEYKDGIFHLNLPQEIRAAREAYFLIQKGHVGDQVDLSDLKLGSMSRISMIHRISLPGLPLKKVQRPPFQHSFGAEVEFFKIMEGEEWDYALRDLSLAFYKRDQLEGVECFLYWR